MVLKPVLITGVFCFCLIGCDIPAKKEENSEVQGIFNENVYQNYERKKAANYFFEYREFSLKDDDCTDNCAQVSVRYPFLKESSINGYNQIIKNHINVQLADFTLLNEPADGTDVLAKAFVKGYQDFKKEFPDVKTPWSIDISIEVAFTHSAFLSLSSVTKAYTGGAHPMDTRAYLNISKEGQLINGLDFFISDRDQMIEIAEKHFRAQHNIPPGAHLSDAGFSFENDQFKLSKQYGFDKTGMVFYYNSYEIGSYAQGPTELIIPYTVLEGIFKFLPQS